MGYWMKLNLSAVSHFTLSAYMDTGPWRYFFFLIVLCLYVLIVLSNVLLVVVICVNRSLHEPMYLFLCSLFVNELYGSTGLFPFLLPHILSDSHTVAAPLCFLQVFSIHSYGHIEFVTLAVMSYDRYLAICFPLQYNSLMTVNRVAALTAIIWFYSLFVILIIVSLTLRLKLCGNFIDKVYCDNFSIVKLCCSDTSVNNIFGLVYLFSIVFGLIVLILFSYIRILKVCFSGSNQTRQKAVSTCSPHLASLLNFSFGAFFEIMQSRFDMSSVHIVVRIVLSLYWLTCQPLFNPLFYGLKLSKIRFLCKSLLFGKKPGDS
uniref:Olfactory receptor n=1 Tax=Scophthalmus maximus TaxID=52904 RepID=A0A8D2ZX18_SCOMX